MRMFHLHKWEHGMRLDLRVCVKCEKVEQVDVYRR